MLVRAAGRHLKSEATVALLAWVMILCATTLVAAGTLYSSSVVSAGLTKAVSAAPSADGVVLITAALPTERIAAADKEVRRAAGSMLVSTGGTIAAVGRSRAYTLGESDAGTSDVTYLASYEGIDDHATLLEGRWASPGATPIEAVLSRAAGQAMGVAVGGEIRAVNRLGDPRPLSLRIVGTYNPTPGDPYWLGSALELSGTETSGPFTATGPLVVSFTDLEAVASGGAATTLDMSWRVVPDVARLDPDNIAVLRGAISDLGPQIGPAVPASSGLRVSSKLPDILEAAQRSVEVARAGVALITVQFAVLAGYALVIVGSMLAARRRRELSTFASRGASKRQLAALLALEGIALVLPAIVVAPLVAAGVVGLLMALMGQATGTGPSVQVLPTGTAFLASASAGVACAAVLALPAATFRYPAVQAGARRSRTRRLAIDMTIVVLAMVGLVLLVGSGSNVTESFRAATGFDPLLVGAPALALIAGALIATRGIPRIAAVASLVLERRTTLEPALTGRRLARVPGGAARPALLLVLACALLVFSAAYAATWRRSQEDQAAYSAGAAIRVVTKDGTTPAWAQGEILRAIEGVEHAVPITTLPASFGSALREGHLVSTDPMGAGVLTFPTGSEGLAASLASLGSASQPGVVPLPIDAQRIGVSIASAVNAYGFDPAFDAASPPDPIEEGGFAMAVSVIVLDGDGRVIRFEAGEVPVGHTTERLVANLTTDVDGRLVAPVGPVSLLGLEIRTRSTDTVGMVGHAGVTGLWTSPDSTGESWLALDAVPFAGWQWTSRSPLGDTTTLAADDRGEVSVGAGYPWGVTQMRFGPTLGAEPLPAIASTAFESAASAGPGDLVKAQVQGGSVTLRIIGSTPNFPSVDPVIPFLIVDARGLSLAGYAFDGRTTPSEDWLLAVADDETEPVARALHQLDTVEAVVVRRDTVTALASDPVQVGLLGALILGVLASVAFASIGFLAGWSLAQAERASDATLLHALGMPRSGRRSALMMESVSLFLIAAALGAGIGILLTYLVLPGAVLGPDGAMPVPQPVIVIPWLFLLVTISLIGIVLMGCLGLARRWAPPLDVASVIRWGDR